MPMSSVPKSLRLLAALLGGLTLSAALGACGYKGPLYMPPPAPDETLTAPPQPADLPAEDSPIPSPVH